LRRGVRVRFFIFLATAIAAVWSLVPTYNTLFTLPKREKSLLDQKAAILSSNDTASVRAQLLSWDRNYADYEQERAKATKNSLHMGLDIQGGMNLTLSMADTVQMPREQIPDAILSDMKVIEGRIDKLGVTEPLLQAAGDRVIIQLPGVVDEARAESLIGKTAVLDFRMLAEEKKTEDIINRIDNYFKGQSTGDSASANASGFRTYISSENSDMAVDEQYHNIVAGMLAQVDTTGIMTDYHFFFGPKEHVQGGDVRKLYLLKRDPELSTADGKLIDKAYARIYQGSDNPQATNTFIVDFTLSRGANAKYNPVAKFATVTQRYIGKRMAIVLDSIVQSAPVIQSKIPDGSGMITTGDISGEKARDLSIVLATGSMQAPLRIESAERIGPSLGADSIRRGIEAVLIGAILVVLFMVIYYSLSGMLAVFAMAMNMLYLFGILGGVMHATLSLPGLAGMALTVGMAVDSNVLIMERIREELRWGKSIRVAIDNGYSRVFSLLIDSHLTTILSSVALYVMGSGPIRGFATTLVIGLVINFITAIFLTRVVYDFALAQFPIQRLRI
jgi:protein-export membrane protein SecD